MNDSDKAQIFSETVDRLLEGHGEGPEELGEMLTIAAWLMERREGPSARFQDELEGKLRRRWEEEYGLPQQQERARRWWIVLPDLGLGRRPVLSGVLIVVVLTISTVLTMPGVRAAAARSLQSGWEVVLQRVGVREVTQVADRKQPPDSSFVTYANIAEAQAQVSFTIREPAYLPPGFRLEGAQVLGPNEVALNYRRDDGPGGRVDLLGLWQYRPMEETGFFEVEPGTSREISLRGQRAIWVAGRGKTNMLIWEEGQLAFSLLSTLSQEEMLHIAESLME